MKWLLPSIVILSIALALLFRVILPFGNVFSDGVQLNTPDGYLMVRYADMWPDIPKVDYFQDYPNGVNVNIKVWPTVIALTARLTGMTNMEAAAVLPPLLFLLTLVPLYIIARILFNRKVAVGSVAVFCLLPGELLNRTMLGAADYHAWELCLVSYVMMFVILAIENRKDVFHLFSYSLVALILWVLYFNSWPGALWLIFVIGICLTLYVYLHKKDLALWISYGAIVGVALTAAFVFYPDITKFYLNELVKMFSLNLGATVTEEMSLFFSFGKFDLNTSWLYFGVCFYLVLVGIGWLAYRYIKERKATDLVFLVWSVISLAMMICRRRYDYYFAFNAAIITSFVLVSVAQYLSISKANKIKIAVVVLMAVCLPLIRADAYIATVNTYMSQGWRDATHFLYGEKVKQDKSEYTMNVMGVECFNSLSYMVERQDAYYIGNIYKFGVFSWWDYGFWILEESHLPTYCQGSERDLEGGILVSTETEKALASLRTLKMRYIVTDKDMLTTKWYPISKGRVIEKEKTLVYKLCNAQEVQGFKRVFASENVTVFEVEK
jgi:asparagine N-glycosylation enzyme membrane subunit Stt3